MKNIAYLDPYWMNGTTELPPAKIVEYVREMKKHGITAQFADVGTLASNGKLHKLGYCNLVQWINWSRETDPDQKIIAYFSFGDRRNGATPNPAFGTARFNINLNEVCEQLLGMGVDGIHLDIEPFLNNDTRLLETLRYLRYNSMRNNHLSICGPDEVWTGDFLKNVCAEVDQINPMVYDTIYAGGPVTNTATYITYVQNKLQAYVSAIGTLPCELVPVFPVYAANPAHDVSIETLDAAVTATKNVITGGATCIKGAAIFWWPHFAGHHPIAYSATLSSRDRAAWMNNWLTAKI